MSTSLRVAAVQQRTLRRQQQVIRQQHTSLQRQAEALVSLEAEVENLRASLRQAGLLKRADTDNPAQPVQDPPSDGPSQSTEETLGPLDKVDVTEEGGVGETPRATTEDVDTTGVGPVPTVEHPGVNEPEDVTAPVAGTEGQRPLSETKTESDVRKNPNAEGETEGLYEDNLGPEMKTSGSRLIAAMRLGRLRIAAGITDEDDDLSLGQNIAKSALSDEAIRQEIETLEKVKATGSKRSASQRPERSRGLVPKPAGGKREAASFTPSPSSLAPSGQTPGDDEFLFD